MRAGGGRGETGRFGQFLDELAAVLGHKDRHGPCRDYCLGLLLDGRRKSMEPMAARLAPASTEVWQQQPRNFMTHSRWEDAAVLAVSRDGVLRELTRAGPVKAARGVPSTIWMLRGCVLNAVSGVVRDWMWM